MRKLTEFDNWQKKCGFKKPKKKLKIYYSTKAYIRTIELVKAHPVEIGWNMMMTAFKDGYRVENIFVYPQKVSSAYISVDLPRYGMWKASLDNRIEARLNGQGHSHVNMSTFPSCVDITQQHDEILSKGHGYYFFQIWNKRNEVNSFFYDITNKIYYTNDDIEIVLEDSDEFVEDSFRMVYQEKPIRGLEVGEGFESEQVI